MSGAHGLRDDPRGCQYLRHSIATIASDGLNQNHGKAYVWFGSRGDKLVALAGEDERVRREPVSIACSVGG